jgi:hypothetical protein
MSFDLGKSQSELYFEMEGVAFIQNFVSLFQFITELR